jgi:MFS family permease
LQSFVHEGSSLNVDQSKSAWLVIFCLVIAGEMIFSLPFHVARYFRPTVLGVFSLSNAALGDIFAVYGVMAMLAYFPGGAIADRFSARKLMTVSLLATAVGGFYMAQIPGRTGLSLLFAYWGMTTILLFWAALIRTTREWGGPLTQGRAFGLLDGGRGLVAAGVAMLAVLLFSGTLPAELEGVQPGVTNGDLSLHRYDPWCRCAGLVAYTRFTSTQF